VTSLLLIEVVGNEGAVGTVAAIIENKLDFALYPTAFLAST
jgi:hypothetical protein